MSLLTFLDISLETANKIYSLGWKLSFSGATITLIGVSLLMWGTRIRDHDFEANIGQLNIDAAKANERAAQLENDAAKSRKRTASLEAEAEKTKEAVAQANERAAKAEARAAEANLELAKRKPERGTWDPSVQYITDDSNSGYAQEISVDVKDYQYQRDQEIAKIDFDFLVDLKQVPSGSTLAFAGVPFAIENGKLTEFTINQTGLNHSGGVTVRAIPNTTRFVVMVNTEGVQKAYVTDGTEGSVRFQGYIVYKTGWYPP